MNGLHAVTSNLSVKETADRVVALIETRGWHLFARIDHAAHAHDRGLDLRPTELILFGDFEIGARLMRNRQSAAIDLPMKALVWEDAHGQVRITHNSTAWLKRRHRLTDDATLRTIDNVLTRICADASGNPWTFAALLLMK